MLVHLEKKVQIESQSGTQVGVLLFDEAPTDILAKYSDYSNIFSAENVVKLLEQSRMNDYAIQLKKSKQPIFNLIYSLGLVGLEILKIYIETNLANNFI